MAVEPTRCEMRWLPLKHVLVLILRDVLSSIRIIDSIDAHRVLQSWLTGVLPRWYWVFKVSSVLSAVSTVITDVSSRNLCVSWCLPLALFDLYFLCHITWPLVFVIPEAPIECFLVFSFLARISLLCLKIEIIINSLSRFNSLVDLLVIVNNGMTLEKCLDSLFVLIVLVQSCKVGEARNGVVHCIAAALCL